MKKRLLALILAGILTASLSSCVSTTKRPEKTGNGTEPQQTQNNGTGENPGTILFQDVNENVYVTVSNLNLRKSTTSTAGAIQVPQFTKLHRIKYSQTWSIVEYNGEQYYASSQYLTNEDLEAEFFTPCADKVMYATAQLNVRRFPSSESFSETLTTLPKNSAVTIVAVSANSSWVKIKSPLEEGKFAFVFSKYLSETENGETNIDYSKFQDYTTPVTMYVLGDLYLRQEPTTEGLIIRTMVKGESVLVTAEAPADEDGIVWVRIKYADEVEPGDPQTYSDGYASKKLLSTTPAGGVTTLDDMLNQYPNFEAKTMNVYASGQTFVRTTPQYMENGENLSTVSLNKKDAVSVVAVAREADSDGIVWYMIHRKDAENKDLYLFVSGKMLTPDPDGNPAPLSLEELLKLYTDFTAEESTQVVSNDSGANCYSAPSTSGTKAMTLAKGTSVTVVAKGTANGAEWYVIRIENGLLYFAGAALFSPAAN